MSEMVERVARAMERPHYDDDATFERDWADPSWELMRHNRRIDARAAIAAMREPTEAMIHEGDEIICDNVGYSNDATAVWRAMVEGALKCAPTPPPQPT